jgi:hypothetical protein
VSRVGVASARGLRLLGAAARAQAQITRNNIEDLRPLFGSPLVSLVSVAILVIGAQPGR